MTRAALEFVTTNPNRDRVPLGAPSNDLIPGADPSLVLDVAHVTKRYGSNTVLSDVSFTVNPGRVTGFLGPNGSGKSTTMKILLDLASADEGEATIGGRRYRELDDPTRTVGVVLEPNAFHPGRSGRNHLRILAAAAGIPRARVEEALELVDLASAADRRAGTYSLGMRQRLSLAAALLGDPPVLILDEPGNGLDPQGMRDLRDLLRARAAGGHTVFVSSHLLAEVEHLADDLIVLDQGRLVAAGSLHDLQHAAALVRTSNADALADVIRYAGGDVDLRGGDALVVRGLSLEEIGERALEAGIALHELSRQAGSLEEMFLDLTGDDRSTSVRMTKEVTQP